MTLNKRSLAFFTAAALVAVFAVFRANFEPKQTEAQAVGGPVIVIMMENHERSSIEGSADADYLKSFENGGISFTHYYAVTHPSLPNYLAVSSGSTQGKSGSDSVTAGAITSHNLWSQLQGHGVSWNVYQESMPSACYKGGNSGQYVIRHNPAIVYANVANRPKKCNKVVPYTAFDVNTLPAVSFITPNICNDMHDCSIATGDNWLQARVPAMLAAGATVVITFDEGGTSTNGGGNVYCAVDGPGISGRTDTATYNHYSLLAALEKRAGVSKLGAAASAAVLPLS